MLNHAQTVRYSCGNYTVRMAVVSYTFCDDHITSCTECRFVFLLSILSFKRPMCNSQGNLTELDDNFSAIGIAATTLLSSKAFL